MKVNRRWVAFVVVLPVVAILTPPFAGQKTNSKTHYLALVGTYTNKTASKGIYAFDFDAESGKLTAKGVAAETPDPSWVVIHPNGKFVYAANESGKESKITAFALDADSGKLAQLNQAAAQGEDPCHMSLDKAGKFLLVANYTSGNVVVFPIQADGKLGTPTANVRDGGALGPNKERQEGPHAHWVDAHTNGAFVYVADLGLDRVLMYRFDAAEGTLSPYRLTKAPLSAKLPSGTGPRHVVFHGDKVARMYVLGELKSTVTLSEFSTHEPNVSTDRTYRSVQTISTLPRGFSGRNDAAEIATDPSGKWLFASNRGRDSIAVFSIDAKSGKLASAGDFPTGGQEPRHFAIDPTGRFLLAENQNSNSIVIFRIDSETGKLTEVSRTPDIPSPVCLTFLNGKA